MMLNYSSQSTSQLGTVSSGSDRICLLKDFQRHEGKSMITMYPDSSALLLYNVEKCQCSDSSTVIYISVATERAAPSAQFFILGTEAPA